MDNGVRSFVTRYRALGLTGTPAAPEEVEGLERRLGVTFPSAYKAFLLILGCDGGPDFVGSDCTTKHLPWLRDGAHELLRRSGSTVLLPEKAVVCLMHQGYFFVYFVADGKSDDPPVFS